MNWTLKNSGINKDNVKILAIKFEIKTYPTPIEGSYKYFKNSGLYLLFKMGQIIIKNTFEAIFTITFNNL